MPESDTGLCRHFARHTWEFAGEQFDLTRRILVVGILNVTPDSFFDGGRYINVDSAVAGGTRMAEEGADIIDVGGESTRPGSQPVDVDEELRRTIPVVEELAAKGFLVSIDTRRSTVADSAIRAGASIVNDVTGFKSPAMIELMSETTAGGIAMHMLGDPRTMQDDPTYEWATGEIALFLAKALNKLSAKGVDTKRIVIDPGIGFGKTVDHNLELLRNTSILLDLGRPVLIGVSRKSFLGGILHLPVEDRLEGSIAAATAAVMRGARLVRVHDVQPTVRAMRIVERFLEYPY